MVGCFTLPLPPPPLLVCVLCRQRKGNVRHRRGKGGRIRGRVRRHLRHVRHLGGAQHLPPRNPPLVLPHLVRDRRRPGKHVPHRCFERALPPVGQGHDEPAASRVGHWRVTRGRAPRLEVGLERVVHRIRLVRCVRPVGTLRDVPERVQLKFSVKVSGLSV